MSMRERLARAGSRGYGCIGDWSEFGEADRQAWFRALDAMLHELANPDDQTITAAYQPDRFGLQPVLAEHVLQAMVMHILNEGRDTKDDAA